MAKRILVTGAATGFGRGTALALAKRGHTVIAGVQIAPQVTELKAVLCRAAENTCYIATVNFAGAGSPTTSAVVRPDGTLLSYQPYGKQGLLIADIDITAATGLFAARCKSV